jgi:hypothetical protein
MNTTIVTALVSGLATGVVVALLNYLLNKRKTDVEITKLKAETEKLIKETQNLSKKIEEGLSSNKPVVHFDSTKASNFDLQGTSAKNWDNSLNKEVGEKAGGDFSFTNGVININRKDTNGRYQIKILGFNTDNGVSEFVKMDVTAGNVRKIHISFEAKIIGGNHNLDFVFKKAQSNTWLAHKSILLNNSNWEKKDIYIRLPNEDFALRIDDRDIEKAPSSIQIRNLQMIETF